MQQDYQDDPNADPNADAIRQGLQQRMTQRSPNTGVAGPGASASGTTPPAPPTAAPPPFDRTAFRDAINGAPNANDVLQRFGLTADKAGRVTLPTGEIMDVIRGAGAGGTTGQWMGVGEVHNGQASMYPPQGAAGPGASASGAVAPGSFQEQIRQMLLKTMTAASAPTTADDPQIKAEMDAQRGVMDRQTAQQRAASAERAAFNGTLNGGQSSGAFDTELNGIQEDAGHALTGIQSQLFSRVTQQKQAQLQQALSLAVQTGDAESARAIQMQIAQMDAEIKRQTLAQQQSQFNDNYGLNVNDAQYTRDRDAARAKAGLPF